MAYGIEKDSKLQELPPPSDKKQVIKDKWWLILEVVWLVALILPLALRELLRKIFPPSFKKIKGQVVLVTGAGRGLGRGLALAFAAEGCKVAVVDVNKTNAADTVAEIINRGGVAKAYFSNIARVEEVRQLHQDITEDFGSVDMLVNNAGLIYADPLEECPDDFIAGVLATNLTSHIWIVREFLPEMKKRNSGHIVAVASMCSFTPIVNGCVYVASKFGLRGFMETVRMELEARNNNKIKTTMVYPYLMNTSAAYMDHCDGRIPAISVKDAVEATMNAIKRDQISVTFPSYFYFLLNVSWMLPAYIVDRGREIFYMRVAPVTKEQKKTHISAVIARDAARINN